MELLLTVADRPAAAAGTLSPRATGAGGRVVLTRWCVARGGGAARRECLDHVLFWNARDLERKLADFQASDNEVRSHASLKGHTPSTFAGGQMVARAELNNVRWVSHCRDLVQLLVAA